MSQITTVEQLRNLLAEPKSISYAKIGDRLDDQAKAFIARSPFLLLATRGEDGTLEVSPKGDEPGFVSVENDRTLLLPDRPGNNLAFGLSNMLANPQVALIFLRPATGETLRISANATLHDDPDLCERLSARGLPAKLVIRLAIERIYFHCAKALIRSNLWKPETWPEPGKISFGRVLASALSADEKMIAHIDALVDEGYRGPI